MFPFHLLDLYLFKNPEPVPVRSLPLGYDNQFPPPARSILTPLSVLKPQHVAFLLAVVHASWIPHRTPQRRIPPHRLTFITIPNLLNLQLQLLQFPFTSLPCCSFFIPPGRLFFILVSGIGMSVCYIQSYIYHFYCGLGTWSE